jgi:hypothetical protein
MNSFSCRHFSSTGLKSCAIKSWKRPKVKKPIFWVNTNTTLFSVLPPAQGKRRFVDFKRVRVCGGRGGDGLVSFKQ